MKKFDWDDEKNELLKRERGISFEEAVFHIENGDVFDIIDHPNAAKYPLQKVYILNIDDYAYLVPFIDLQDVRFLKTIIPSRKMTRRYLYNNEN